MTAKHVVIVGASRLGCQIALTAKQNGLDVTLIDEHPQSLSAMSFDAPYFYGAGLPSAISDEAAMFDNILSSSDLLMECAENDVDLQLGTIVWGEFHNSENRKNIGAPKVAVISEDGNALLEYDYLILATGARDFVPSFKGWELPGVFGMCAGEMLLTRYQCFNGTRTLVLGSSTSAISFARIAREKGVEIAGLVEPDGVFHGTDEDAAWLEGEGIPVYLNSVILSADGKDRVTSATIISCNNFNSQESVNCDTICVAISDLPNVELPSAMGCQMVFDEDIASWIPKVSKSMETSIPNVYWVSRFIHDQDQILRIDAALNGNVNSLPELSSSRNSSQSAAAMHQWISNLHATGGEDVILCQCESVTRSEFLSVTPPRYLKQTLRYPKSLVNEKEAGPAANLDQAKRLTRVGMGHCQGKRCRDEASILLAQRFGIPVRDIKPGSYRFPVRPLDLEKIASPDGDSYTRGHWQNWPEPPELRNSGISGH